MNINAISIIIPIYNELENIEPIYHEVKQTLDNIINFEVIFVDDASKDGSTNKLKTLSNQYHDIRVLKHKKNYGQSAAIFTGIYAASYPWILTLDGDRQNNPADVHKLLKIAGNIHQEHKAIIVGVREKDNDNWLRRIGSHMHNSFRQLLLRDGCPDTDCNLKLFPKATFLNIPHFNHMHRFIPSLFKREGYKVIKVPVNHRPRMHGKSKYGMRYHLFSSLIDLFGVMWLNHRRCQPKLKND